MGRGDRFWQPTATEVWVRKALLQVGPSPARSPWTVFSNTWNKVDRCKIPAFPISETSSLPSPLPAWPERGALQMLHGDTGAWVSNPAWSQAGFERNISIISAAPPLLHPTPFILCASALSTGPGDGEMTMLIFLTMVVQGAQTHKNKPALLCQQATHVLPCTSTGRT